tara:strand:+ start:259 stop:456 length:198 start_codon:yes stop_codon:yes gene_type:complete
VVYSTQSIGLKKRNVSPVITRLERKGWRIRMAEVLEALKKFSKEQLEKVDFEVRVALMEMEVSDG